MVEFEKMDLTLLKIEYSVFLMKDFLHGKVINYSLEILRKEKDSIRNLVEWLLLMLLLLV
jgi:hypothetical protein